VSAIEALTDDQIRAVVNTLADSVASQDEKNRIADGLIGRRPKVRGRMKALGSMVLV
jgi:hypothetical protein